MTGIDLAEDGVAKAKRRAADPGMQFNAIIQDVDHDSLGTQQWDLVCLLYFSGYPNVREIEKRIAFSLKLGGYVIAEGPAVNPKDLTDGLEVCERLGTTVLRPEYRAQKADWGQPSFSRMLLRKKEP